jgi:hypothetical protein
MKVLDGEIDRVSGVVDAQADFQKGLVWSEIPSDTDVHGL